MSCDWSQPDYYNITPIAEIRKMDVECHGDDLCTFSKMYEYERTIYTVISNPDMPKSLKIIARRGQ
jgi:hypothetical protein